MMPTCIPSKSRRIALRGRSFMVSCATAAVAASLLLPARASAQSAPGAFQGSIQSSTGIVDRATSGANETITIGSPTATLNWTPYDGATGGGAIDFLPSGHVATFINNPDLTADYTVLNRIVPNDPTRPIIFNGSVISQLTDGASTAVGGHVWFYSPGGIVIGSTAVFDVGGLLLTTADLPNGFGANSSSFSAFFSAPSAGSAIQVLNGAQINAQNNYVALIAPRIEQGGTVNVNGSAAYVAGEQLTMSFNQGLFDVSVDVGTDDANGIVHTGTTTGTGNFATGDNHSIYMVVVPKNNAINMLLQGGSIGFADVTGATVENGQIILSSGYGVTTDDSNNVVISGLERGGAIQGERGSITIDGGTFTSDVFAYASDSISASGAGGLLGFDHDVTFQALYSASLNAYEGDTVTVGGDAAIHADDLRNFVGTNEGDFVNASAGGAGIDALGGGSITIAGNATVTANAASTVNLVTGDAGVASAGSASILSEGGTVTIGGNATVEASAFGDTRDNGFDGRTSFGGIAEAGSYGGLVDIGGDLQLLANGTGTDSALASGGTGGTGFGGIAEILASDSGTVNVHGATAADALGTGGGLIHSADGTGGEGRGGTAVIDSSTGGTIAFGGDTDLRASGYGATSPAQGGEGDGGTAGLSIDGGAVTAGGRLALYSDGFGGDGITAGNGYGGSSYAFLSGVEGASGGGSLQVAGDLRIQAGGWGGFGLDNLEGTGGLAGDGYGGDADFYITNFLQQGASFDVQLADVFVAANGEGGSGGSGASGGSGGGGYAGSASTELYSGTVTAGLFETFATGRGGFGGGASAGLGGAGGVAVGGWSSVTIDTALTANTVYSYDRAIGGLGGEGPTEGDGGAALGGNATIDILANGNLSASADLSTVATGGDGNNGGSAEGGWSGLTVDGVLNGPTAIADSGATGGSGLFGNGGSAFGGESDIRSTGSGSLTVTNLTVASNAAGGNGVNGGDAFAGGADAGAMDSSSAKFAVTNLATAVANGTGGAGIASGTGGDGSGGSAGLHSGIEEADLSGTTTLKNALVQANGTGGQGGIAGNGFGGDGHAGALDGSFTITGTLNGSAEGRGGLGIGSVGGTGSGGEFLIGANLEGDLNPASVNIAAANLSVLGFGGSGGVGSAGGDGYGGLLQISVGTTDASLTLGTLTANVKGQGGDGGNGSTGGDGGFGYGGFVTSSILGTLSGGDWTISARGIGGTGGSSVTGIGGDGGYGEGGTTSIYTGSQSSIHAASYATDANGIGGDGGHGAASGNGGEAQGGYNESTLNGTTVFSGTFLTTAFAWGGIGAIGGDATGGTSQITVNGALSAGLVQSTGQAEGGAGTTSGGNASGGSAALDVNGSLSADNIIVATRATGGNASTGGGAVGGTSYLTSFGSLTAGDIAVSANATGGSGSAGPGGDALAGEAIFESHGALSASSNVVVDSDALGGAGSTGGGDAYGYSAALRIAGGTASLTGTSTISATGTGGSTGNGTGGSGYGGYARTSTYGGGVATLDDLTVDSSGFGGVGENGGAGYGSESVEGWGGSVAQVLDPGSTLTLSGQTNLLSNGTGGFGRTGTGGRGVGGTTHLTAADRPLGAVNVLMAANGIGGSGLIGGGNATGGDSIVSGQGAPLKISGEGIVQANATGGNGGSGTGGFALAGYSDVESSGGGSLSGGSLAIQADAIGGGGALSGAASGGLVNLVADAVESGLSTTIAFDTISASASAAADDGTGTEGPPSGAAGFITILAPGGSISAGTFSALANGTSAGGDITMASALDPAGIAGGLGFGSVDLRANGGGGDVSISAASGTTVDLGVANVEASGAGSSMSLAAGDCGCSPAKILSGSLSLASGGDIGLSSTSGGRIDVAGDALVVAGGDIVGNSLHAAGSAALIASGNLAMDSLVAGSTLTILAGGDLDAASLAASDMAVLAGGSLTVADATADGSAAFFAGGLARFTGTISAPEISVTSSDIDVAAGASLGVFGITDTLALTAVTDQAAIIGDQGAATPPGQYVLNEDGDIEASNIFVSILGGDAKIYNVDIDGSETAGGGVSNLFVSAAGSIFVNGLVDFTNAGANDSLTLAAAGNIELNTGSGGIQMTDSGGAYAGLLTLFGTNVWVGSGDLLSQLEANPNFAGRDDALKTNTGPLVADGYVRAGTIGVAIADSFFVQNSGTSDAFAGLTAGDGGLTVVSLSGQPTQEITALGSISTQATGAELNIFGHQVRSNGTIVSGKDFANAVTTVGTFAAGSAINGCPVGNCGPDVPPTPTPSPAPPPQVSGSESILGPIGMVQSPVDAGDQSGQNDQDDDSDDDSDGKGSKTVDPMAHLINTSPIHVDQTIDQPITSGNDTAGAPH